MISGTESNERQKMTHHEVIEALAALTPEIDWCQECGGFRETPQGSREAWLNAAAEAVLKARDQP